MAKSNLLDPNGSQFIKSNEPADAGYGRNGYSGASSDLPGKKTTTSKATKVAPPQSNVPSSDWQTRAIDASPIKPAHGMRDRSLDRTIIPSANSHAVTKPIARK